MGYQIEIYLDNRHYKPYLIQNIMDNAAENNCERGWNNYEISGIRHTTHKNRYVMTFIFPDNEKYIIKFINFIKKTPQANIYTIGYDNCVFRMLYPKKSKNLVESDQHILNALK